MSAPPESEPFYFSLSALAELGGAVHYNRSAQEIPKNKGVLRQDGFTRVTGFSQTFSVCCVHPLKPHSNPKGLVDQKFREELRVSLPTKPGHVQETSARNKQVKVAFLTTSRCFSLALHKSQTNPRPHLSGRVSKGLLLKLLVLYYMHIICTL